MIRLMVDVICRLWSKICGDRIALRGYDNDVEKTMDPEMTDEQVSGRLHIDFDGEQSTPWTVGDESVR